MNDVVNVIIPTYRPGEYLYECLSSIINQEKGDVPYTLHTYIILNGEREPFYSQINEYIREHHMQGNTTLVYTEEKGVSNARNQGIELSQECDYIAFVDDDDLLAPNYIVELLNALMASHEYTIAQANTCSLLASGTLDYNHYIAKDMARIITDGILYSPVGYRRFLNSVCTKLIPLSCIGDTRFNTELSNSEDALFMFELTAKLKNIVLAPNTSYIIREREGSATRTKRKLGEYAKKCWLFITHLSKVYFAHPKKYSGHLYLTRLLASVKHMLGQMKSNR